jgi:hypothetical protein
MSRMQLRQALATRAPASGRAVTETFTRGMQPAAGVGAQAAGSAQRVLVSQTGEPAALAHYAPLAPPAQVLRDSSRAAAQGLHTRMESLLNKRLQSVERTVHTQVVHEIVHGSMARERVREEVGATLFSPKVLAALVDRMHGALARRDATERYRRGTD